MRFIQHLSNTGVLAPPRGASPEECLPLPVTHVEFIDGSPGVCSFWKPSEEELALLNAGAAVRLTVVGVTHPPLAIGVDGDQEIVFQERL